LELLTIVVSDRSDEVFHTTHWKKFNVVKVGDLGGQEIGAPLPIQLRGIV
jgi:hypothetical protein